MPPYTSKPLHVRTAGNGAHNTTCIQPKKCTRANLQENLSVQTHRRALRHLWAALWLSAKRIQAHNPESLAAASRLPAKCPLLKRWQRKSTHTSAHARESMVKVCPPPSNVRESGSELVASTAPGNSEAEASTLNTPTPLHACHRRTGRARCPRHVARRRGESAASVAEDDGADSRDDTLWSRMEDSKCVK